MGRLCDRAGLWARISGELQMNAHDHALAIMCQADPHTIDKMRDVFERKAELGERTICDAVNACQSLGAVETWQLRENYPFLQEAMFFLQQAMERVEGKNEPQH
jgi:hypothetical protein